MRRLLLLALLVAIATVSGCASPPTSGTGPGTEGGGEYLAVGESAVAYGVEVTFNGWDQADEYRVLMERAGPESRFFTVDEPASGRGVPEDADSFLLINITAKNVGNESAALPVVWPYSNIVFRYRQEVLDKERPLRAYQGLSFNGSTYKTYPVEVREEFVQPGEGETGAIIYPVPSDFDPSKAELKIDIQDEDLWWKLSEK